MFMYAVTMTCSHRALADEFEQVYVQKYKNEMLPELKLSKIDRYKAQGLTEAQIDQQLEILANKAADCQFRTFQAYESKYQQVAFNALLAGGTTEDASLRLNEALDKAVNNGNMTATEMSNRVKKAMDLYNACVIRSGLMDK